MKLSVCNVSKAYGEKKALSDFSVEFEEGIYGLLGPNGAGKSTLMNILTDNISRDSGDILLDGKEILSMGREYRKLLGYMPQEQGLYEGFSARQYLYYVASLKGLKRKETKQQVEDKLKIVGLDAVAHKRIGGFSGGMKQRVMLASALIGNPKILIMDEPTAGLDPKERIRIRNFIEKLSEDRIVFIATHVVGDVESIAKEILLIKGGTLIQKGQNSLDFYGKVYSLKEVEDTNPNTCMDLPTGSNQGTFQNVSKQLFPNLYLDIAA